MISDATPPAEVPIDDALVAALLHSQFPDLAGLPLGSRHEGWDNVTIRLGDDLAVRLPRRKLGATLVVTEFEWLPKISAEWTFPIPRPVRIGEPEADYPWRWSVVTWLQGTVAYDAPLSADGARDLGQALAQVHVAAPRDAPRNPYRSIPLTSRAERLDLQLEVLVARFGDAVHPEVARAIFRDGALREPGPVTWAHLDIHGRNVITTGGRLSGLLDWGDAAAGDPAADLGQALTLVGDELFDDLARSYADAGGGAGGATFQGSLSAATVARIRAEGVAYATLLAGIDEDGHSAAGWKALAAWGVADAGVVLS
ncbi:phosphotransferase [Demequina lutea]|uniref:Aminoglycoside phosphotransferase (APT) family kinase protein n=1 Tax=Demequina lutea TaxID=431489 RepID=A0A7Y9Z8R9_9MICO|nr:phosphotransferase [Demequina lutea]NYI40053.1 aminoglycoside phosphotransferase (APT) family kinase protein [Demequina lutea]